jgi:hypothetical protein
MFYPVDIFDNAVAAGSGLHDLFDAAIMSCGRGKLHSHVAGVIKTVFNIDVLRSMLLETRFDTTRCPNLLPRDRLLSGCSLLSEIAAKIEVFGENSRNAVERMQLIDCSNHFFTIVPHSFDTYIPIVSMA